MSDPHQLFLDAIANKRRVTVRFFHRKENREMTKTCAPLDFGPLRGAYEPREHYQLWDLEGKRKPLNVVFVPEDLRELTVLEETFDPAAIITWQFKPNSWLVPRDWAEFS